MRNTKNASKLIGRESEIALLTDKYLTNKSELVVLYGRRRVGKSSLIQEFSARRGSKAISLYFEGLERQRTSSQIAHFAKQLKNQINDPLLQIANFTDWHSIFDFLSRYFEQQKSKTIITLDEFQWLAANQSRLVALIKFYWDNHWKKQNVMLILCGSIASFMVKKVLRSKALYGRFTLQINLKKLSPSDARDFFPRSKSADEIVRYLTIFGGVPKYLEELTLSKSLEQNIENLLFSENGLFLEEFDKIFNVHFKEPRTYLAIVRALSNGPMNLEEIATALKVKSSGGLKVYLDNLEMAEFIRPNFSQPFKNKRSGYRIADEFILFYLKFILPNKRLIFAGGGRNLLINKISKQLVPWFGLALENYLINNALFLAARLDFADKVESYGTYLDSSKKVQIDLVYLRSDKTITVCEIEFRTEKISTQVIPEFEEKLKRIKVPRLHSVTKVLVAANGASKELMAARYFDKIITSEDLLTAR
jgi:AAA+ ATPase superfamily predicted ATPase